MRVRNIWLVGPAVLLLLGADVKPSCACTTKERAYVPAMKSDLRNLATAQESFRADSNRYASSFDELTPTLFRATAGVSVTLDSGNARGWSAHASHASTAATCAMTTTIAGTDSTDGVPVCHEVESATHVSHRYRFYAFIAITAFVGLTAALGHGRWNAFVALLVLCGLNPYLMDPTTGMDCGASIRTMSKAWLAVAAGVAIWQRLKQPAPAIRTPSALP